MCNHKRYLHNIKSLHIKEIETWTKVAILQLNACKHTWSPISTYQGKVCSLHKFVELCNLFLQLFPIQCGITRLWRQLFIWNRSRPITWICLVLFLERGNIMHNYVTKGINFIAFRLKFNPVVMGPGSLTWGKGQSSQWSHLQRTTNVVHQILVEDL